VAIAVSAATVVAVSTDAVFAVVAAGAVVGEGPAAGAAHPVMTKKRIVDRLVIANFARNFKFGFIKMPPAGMLEAEI
jgi:hypothetical protein